MAIHFTLKKAIKYIHHSCVMISTNNTTVVYINKQGGTHSPNLCIEVWEILHWCLEHDIMIRVCHIPGKFSILADSLSRLDRPLKTEWALDQLVANSIFQMLNYPNVDLFATQFNHKVPLYVSPVPDNHALMIDTLSMNWNLLHAYAPSDTLCYSQDTSVSVQNSSYCFSLAPTSVVLRGIITISISSNSSSALSKTSDTIKTKVSTSTLHAWELSSNQLEIKKLCKMLQILSQNQDEHLLRKSVIQNGSYTPTGVIERRLILSRPLLQSIADFLIYLFSEKKYQVSTIKGYRSMISNTLKFKTGNRIGSNPVFSELIRSFKLQRPVQRSLTPKWDLSWVLVCLQKAPYEPLHKASKLHVTIKIAFLLALATAKRCSKFMLWQ